MKLFILVLFWDSFMSEPGVYIPNKKVVVEIKGISENFFLGFEVSFVNICLIKVLGCSICRAVVLTLIWVGFLGVR